MEAIVHIFDELGGREGVLVASRIADSVGITRSVIVNALRKLESAGVIESRSSGMRGTYIKIVNEYIDEALDDVRGHIRQESEAREEAALEAFRGESSSEEADDWKKALEKGTPGSSWEEEKKLDGKRTRKPKKKTEK